MAAAGRTGCCGFWLLRREGEEGPMMIDAKTKVLGLIGYPVGHSVSPVIHNSLAEIYGQNLVYVPLQAAPGKLEKAIEGAAAFNFPGMNVTVPYKSEVIPYLKEIDAPAKRIGAVNTLVRTEGGYKGYNTDMPGLYRAMCGDGVRLEGEKALILGAGGVARAVAMLLSVHGASQIVILNRTVEKAERLAEEINTLSGRQLAEAMALTDYGALPRGEKYLAIQATNLGMFPRVEEAVIEDRAFYEKIHTGYDLIFNPSRTKFMSLVEEMGGRAFNGLRMLLYQGIIAYELWTGVKVDEELAGKAYGEMRRAMKPEEQYPEQKPE